MTDQIEEIKTRIAAATPGPWKAWNTYHDPVVPRWSFGNAEVSPDQLDMPTAKFIAAAPDDIAYLLQLVEEKDAEIERLKTGIEQVCLTLFKADITRTLYRLANPGPYECAICKSVHGESLTRGQWRSHWEWHYEDSRDTGASKDNAVDYASREMEENYGPEPTETEQ